MAIADWFKPRWQHRDRDVAVSTVNEITDQAKLAEIALEPRAGRAARAAAIRRLTDQGVVKELSELKVDWKGDTALAIVEKLTDQDSLTAIAIGGDFDNDARLSAIKKITNQESLRRVVRELILAVRYNIIYPHNRLFQIAIIGILTDQTLLAQIASEISDSGIRQAALDKIHDKSVRDKINAKLPVLWINGVPLRPDEPMPPLRTVEPVAPPRRSEPSESENLLNAAKDGNAALVRSLIAKGVDVNARTERYTYRDYSWYPDYTPLHFAAGLNHKEVAKLLLTNGADVNAKGTLEKWTPLFQAMHGKRLDMVKLLLDHGADPNAINEGGATPLRYAINGRQNEIAALLRKYGGHT